MNGYVKTFKDIGADKNKNNKLMPLLIDDDSLLEKYKTVLTKIEDLDALTVHNRRYIKTKIRTYGYNIFTNFCSLNVPEDGVECESFTVISIDSLLFYKKNYLQVLLDICAYKIVDTQKIDYLDDNHFGADED